MLEMWVEVAKRYQNKCALVQVWVRYTQARLVNDGIAVEQNIQIQCARAPSRSARATKLSLNRQQVIQQLSRGKSGANLQYRIEKIRLIDHADRRGFIDRRSGDNSDFGMGVQNADRLLERLFSIP